MSTRNHSSRRDILIMKIVETLKVSPARREECRDQVIFCIEAAKTRSEFNKKNEHYRSASPIPPEGPPAPDRPNYVSRGYAVFEQCLKDAIDVSDGIATRIDVPHGQKPRVYEKYEAKSLAVSLVGKFASYDSDPARRQLQNHIASLLYELLTGMKDVDIPESAYRPPFLKTRGAIRTQR